MKTQIKHRRNRKCIDTKAQILHKYNNNNVVSTYVAITCVYANMYIICVMCIRKYECMHCIILYFVATCKRPFGPLLLNKMKAKNNTQYHIKSQQTEGKLRRKHVTPLFVNVSILQPMMHVLTHTEVELITVYDFSELNIM